VDTSAWIAFLRPGSTSMSNQVEALIEQDAAAIVGPVLAELLQGVKGQREAQQLRRVMSILPYREITREDWQSAGEELNGLRRRGVKVPLTDALIAAVARRLDQLVLTLDGHFDHLAVRRLRVD